MNIAVNSQKLAAELRLLNKIVPSKPTLAILSHVLMTADARGLGFWATDLEVGLSGTCPARITEPGVVALPVAKLLALVEQFPDDDVVIGSDARQVAVRCGTFKSRLQAIAADDFPKEPEVEGITSTLDGGALKQLISRTQYSIDATKSKFLLNGALLELSGASGAMVTTDGKRLSLAMTSRTGPDARFIIPAKTLDVLASHVIGDCEMTVGAAHLSFASNGRMLTSRTIEGKFPAYQRMIPQENKLVVVINRIAFTAALRRVNLVSAAESSAVYFDLQPGRLEMSTSSVDVGSADEVVPVQYDGEPLKVCVNGEYVLDFLNAASEATVTMMLKDEKTAMMFADGESSVSVIMLMKG